MCLNPVGTRLSSPEQNRLTDEVRGGPLQDPAAADSGKYRCHAKNEFGETNANLSLNIEPEPEPEPEPPAGQPPTFVGAPAIRPESERVILLEVRVRSESKIAVKWTHMGQAVRETDRLQLAQKEQKHIHTLHLRIRVGWRPVVGDRGMSLGEPLEVY